MEAGPRRVGQQGRRDRRFSLQMCDNVISLREQEIELRINEIRWQDDRVDHILGAHGLRPEEVEEACYGKHFVHRTREGRYVLYGNTSSGQYLKVILLPLGGGAFRPITALRMNEAQKRRFQRKGK